MPSSNPAKRREQQQRRCEQKKQTRAADLRRKLRLVGFIAGRLAMLQKAASACSAPPAAVSSVSPCPNESTPHQSTLQPWEEWLMQQEWAMQQRVRRLLASRWTTGPSIEADAMLADACTVVSAPAAECLADPSLPRWRTMQRAPLMLTMPDGKLVPYLRRADFVLGEAPPGALEAAVVWEYQPGFGTTAPPPTQANTATWRGCRTWTSAQDQWYLFFDVNGELPSSGAERAREWKNAIKRYARAVLAWRAGDGDTACNDLVDAEAERCP